MWKAWGAISMPDEKTQGGYATIFHNHLNHQVKKLTITARIDASQPKGMSVKALDQQAGRKPRPKSAQMEQHWVDKTYKTIADMSVRTQTSKHAISGAPKTAQLSQQMSRNKGRRPSHAETEHARLLGIMARKMKEDSLSRLKVSAVTGVPTSPTAGDRPISARPLKSARSSRAPSPPASSGIASSNPATVRRQRPQTAASHRSEGPRAHSPPHTSRSQAPSSALTVSAHPQQAAAEMIRQFGIQGALRAGIPKGGVVRPATAHPAGRDRTAARRSDDDDLNAELDAAFDARAYTQHMQQLRAQRAPPASAASATATAAATAAYQAGQGNLDDSTLAPALAAAVRHLTSTVEAFLKSQETQLYNPYVEFKKRLVDVIVDHRVYKRADILVLFQSCRRYPGLDPSIVSLVITELTEELALGSPKAAAVSTSPSSRK